MITYQDGIYRTTRPLTQASTTIDANRLVLIRTEDDFGPASVLAPQVNTHNQWSFATPGLKLRDADDLWGRSLVQLPPEGFYTLTRERVFSPSNRWPVGALVQLGYNRQGRGILFIARRRASLDENDLFFASSGQGIDDEWFSYLSAVLYFDEARPAPATSPEPN
ncbi:MAG: hypothetical protein B7733_24160 [Myxococcales bacterium FL481]|nr:MAG: hypothetical protein B7733_24160 [Myxococcales bacterium FL481]